ncbi:VOC family protein [Paenibacillus puldeungensis]|uniref:VOC family protein n=1 Tax=Paenibacillus puldeungensis TaxID=696536 RepID=A0ABW3S111_9BACL
MALTLNMIFVNLPVKDLQKSKEFFTQVGFTFNPQFTNEQAACMVISEHIFAMLLTEEYFKTFTNKQIVDTENHTEAILALSANSREQVDEIVNKALASGGKPYNDIVDHGFMYSGSFQDPDGHLWEVMYMDPSSIQPFE